MYNKNIWPSLFAVSRDIRMTLSNRPISFKEYIYDISDLLAHQIFGVRGIHSVDEQVQVIVTIDLMS